MSPRPSSHTAELNPSFSPCVPSVMSLNAPCSSDLECVTPGRYLATAATPVTVSMLRIPPHDMHLVAVRGRQHDKGSPSKWQVWSECHLQYARCKHGNCCHGSMLCFKSSRARQFHQHRHVCMKNMGVGRRNRPCLLTFMLSSLHSV